MKHAKIDVYVMGIIHCPMTRNDQDSDLCIACNHFGSHMIDPGDTNDGRKRAHPRLAIKCDYTGKTGGIYQSDRSGRRISVVSGEPLPAKNEIDGEWSYQ